MNSARRWPLVTDLAKSRQRTGRANLLPVVAGLLAIFASLPAIAPQNAGAATLSLTAPSTKVCQLTGDTDWATNQPTDARTYSQYGLDGVDLGFPVDSGAGLLYFLFGDAWPTMHPAGSIPSVPPDDALGWTMRSAAPDTGTCLDMKMVATPRHIFAHPTVLPPIRQGSFNVPTGGVFLDGFLYAFFWTDHCAKPQQLTPQPDDPLRPPPPNSQCLENPEINSVGRSVIARALPSDPVLFRQTAAPKPALLALAFAQPMPSGFVYVSAAKPAPERSAIELGRPGIPVFGVARYRASVPYLALAPEATFGDPQTWSFFAGRANGSPVWITRQQWESGHNANGDWAPPAGAEIYEPLAAGERCIGEHSVTWNGPLHSWLLLYNCGPWTIEARTAPQPWGPWSPPTVILSPEHDHDVVCTLIMSPQGCPGLVRRNYWPPQPNGNIMPGFFYAPFVLDRFTRAATPVGSEPSKQATIYWLVSTWNPYNVVVMQSTLAITE